MKSTSNEIAHIAYHEAGHVLINYYCGWTVDSFVYDESTGLAIANSNKELDKEWLWVNSLTDFKNLSEDEYELIKVKYEDRILLAMAGEVSQWKYQDKSLNNITQFPHIDAMEDNRTDIYKVFYYVNLLQDILDYQVITTDLLNKCKQIINDNWAIIENLAKCFMNSAENIVAQQVIEEIITKHSFKPKGSF